jgi:CHAT domain-containing protein
VPDDFGILTLEDLHYDEAGTRRAEGAVRAFFESVSVASLEPLPPAGKVNGRALVARCRPETQSRYATLLHVEGVYDPQSDHGFLIGPACHLLEMELNHLVTEPARAVADDLVGSGLPSRTAEVLESWRSRAVPRTLGTHVIVFEALRLALEKGRTAVRDWLLARFSDTYLALLRGRGPARCLDLIRTRFSNPAMHGVGTFDAAAYQEFVRLVVGHRSFTAWDAEGPDPDPPAADAGFLHHLLAQLRWVPPDDPVSRLLDLHTPSESPLEIRLRVYAAEASRPVRTRGARMLTADPTLEVKQTFALGEEQRLSFQANRDCQLLLLLACIGGGVGMVWPNRWCRSAAVEGGRPYFLPGLDAPEFRFVVTGRPRTEHVKAIATSFPLPVFLPFENNAPFRLLTPRELEDLLVAVARLGPTEWATAESSFQVVSQRPTATGVDRDQFTRRNQEVLRLYQEGKYEQAVTAAEQLCADVRGHLGENGPEFAAAVNALALLHHALGHYAIAEPLLKQALGISRAAHGDTHPAYATRLNNLAELYLAMGNYATARTLHQEAAQLRRAALGDDNPDYAQSLNNLAEVHAACGDPGAEALFRQALDIRLRTLGATHPAYATTLSNLGNLLLERGDLDGAEPLLRQALKVREQGLGQRHPHFAQSLLDLARLTAARGKDKLAVPLFARALEVFGDSLGEDHPSYATTLNAYARLCRDQAEYTGAERLFRQALEIRRETFGEDHASFAETLNDLAGVFYLRGEYSAAEPLAQQALAVLRRTLGEDHPAYADALDRLGRLYRVMGRYADAEAPLSEALRVREKTLGPGHPLVAESLGALARLLQYLGNQAAAEPLYCRSLEILRATVGEEHQAYARILRRLAELHRERGAYEAAEPLLRQALEIRRTLGGENHRDFAISLRELATVQRLRGNYAEAMNLARRAIDLFPSTLREDHPSLTLARLELGNVYRLRGRFVEAEQQLREALTAFRKVLGENHITVGQALDCLAGVCAATNRDAEALRLMQEAAAVEDHTIGQVFATGSEARRARHLDKLRKRLDSFLSLTAASFAGYRPAARAALDLVLRRKALTAEALAVQRDAVLGGKYPDLLPQLRELTALRMQIAQQTLAGPGAGGGEAHEQLLDGWRRKKEELEETLARRVPEMTLERQLRTADCAGVARALPEGSALIEYVRYFACDLKTAAPNGDPVEGPARYVAFVLPAGDPERVALFDLGAAEPIDQAVAAFRALLRTPSGRTDTDAGQTLCAAVFDPLRGALGGRTRLFLAPDGNLARLPFEALPAADGLHLIDTFRMSYLGTGRDVLRFGAVYSDQPGEPVVVADPDFDLAVEDAASGQGPVPRLSGARAEGEKIAALLGVQPWVGARALKRRLKNLHSPGILHLATVGYYLDPANPSPAALTPLVAGAGGVSLPGERLANPLLRSGLVLAGANTRLRGAPAPEEAENGLLTAEEVTGLDLLDTEMVVLAAPETELGEGSVREGLRGMRQAFHIAGAKTVVACLWPPADQEMVELMEDFYRRLLAGEGRAEALREAQLAARRRRPHPFFWAPFICQGEAGPLPEHYTLLQPHYRSFTEAVNPYVTGRFVAGAKFIGRTDILKCIRDNLGPSAGQNILVLRGQRRSGKTSVLKQLQRTLPQECGGAYLPAYFDLQGMGLLQNEAQFFRTLAETVRRDLAAHGVAVPETSAADFDANPIDAFEFRFLPAVVAALGDRQVLLMIDEFEKLKELIDDKVLRPALLDYCRHLMQHSPLLFLIAGSQRLRELTGGQWSVFFNLAEVIDIGPLTDQEARRLITEPVQPWFHVGKLLQDELIRVSGCYPYYTQLVCSRLVEVRNERRVTQVKVAHVREAIERALSAGEEQIAYAWTHEVSGPADRLVLAQLAGQGADGAAVAVDDLRRPLEEAGQAGCFEKALSALEINGIVRSAGGRVAFTVPLLQLWLARQGYDTLDAALRYNRDHAFPPRGPTRVV